MKPSAAARELSSINPSTSPGLPGMCSTVPPSLSAMKFAISSIEAVFAGAEVERLAAQVVQAQHQVVGSAQYLRRACAPVAAAPC